jgi:hypothetical protein
MISRGLAIIGAGLLAAGAASGQAKRAASIGVEASRPHHLVADPVPELVADLPELAKLRPADDPSALPGILAKVGERVAAFTHDAASVTAREEVSQQILDGKGDVRKRQDSVFNYIILSEKGIGEEHFEEYRTGWQGNRSAQEGLEQGYMITKQFATTSLHFDAANQRDSTFRYLGDDVVDGADAFVIAFAQNVGARMTSKVTRDDVAQDILMQGLAWISKESFQLLRMRNSLPGPIPSVGLTEQTTDVRFAEVRPEGIESTLWLPQQVTVTATHDGQRLRNLHRYSEWRLFRVSIQIKPVPQ